jgi:hypothetical protein
MPELNQCTYTPSTDASSDTKAGESTDNQSTTPTEEEEEEAASADQTATTTESAEPAPADEKSTPAADSDDAKSKELEKIIAERKRIETENQRKLDEYKATLDKGRQEVKDLNLRFGDWYFVVSNDTFQKIRLGRGDVIKKKDATKKADASAAGAPGTAVPGLPSLPGAGQ